MDPFLLDLCIKADESTDIPNLNDSLTVERILMERASKAARFAHSEITERLGLAFFRPPAIATDMFKSEEAIQKVKQRKVQEEAAAKELERIRKEREQKRFSKKMAAEAKVAKQTAASKQKKEIEMIRKTKGKSMLNDVGKDEFEVEVDETEYDHSEDRKRTMKGRGKSSSKSDRPSSKSDKPSSKRQYKNEKYGFGGKKRGKKSNTRESTDAEADGFNPKKMKAPFRNGIGKSASKAKQHRPGKQRRQRDRSKKASRR